MSGHPESAYVGGPSTDGSPSWSTTSRLRIASHGTRGGFSAAHPAPSDAARAQPIADYRDRRIRAVVADAPLAVVFDPTSLSAVTVPVLVEYGGADVVSTPRFHAETLCAAIPHVTCVRSPAAGHFALMQAGTGRLGPPGDDPSEDPSGFDRAAWQFEAWPRIRDFLATSLR